MELSIVIPVYNEEENVEPLIGEIETVMASAATNYQIIGNKATGPQFVVLRGTVG